MSRTRPDASGDKAAWWRDAVVYQIYPRSFADAGGDGIGDLPGIIGRLDYVKSLGVDAIWLSPFYRSPQADSGYDISDFRDVDPLFGTLQDFDYLVHEVHSRGLRLIVDMVPNHTSSAHRWFQEALRSAPGSPARQRYIFRDGLGVRGEQPPNNWQSLFSGPAWSRVPGPAGEAAQWYLHLFDTSQPDLNWENPEVHGEFQDILRFWLDRGVDGFRVDVARGLIKAPGLPDYPVEYQVSPSGAPDGTRTPLFDQPGVHDVYRQWRQIVQEYPGDRMLVAEAHVEPPARLAHYVRPDEMHQAFNFEFLATDYSAEAVRTVVAASLDAYSAVGAPATWVLSDHDDVRHRTRFGRLPDGTVDLDLGLRCALTMTAIMLALPGCAYLYQGEELGLPEHLSIPAHARRDPTFLRSGGMSVGRDGCRVPLPWSRRGRSYGFSATGAAWLPQPRDWADLSVEAQEGDPWSTLNLYRRAVALRKAKALGRGTLRWNAQGGDVVDFWVNGVRVVANLGSATEVLPPGDVLLATTVEAGSGVLPAHAAVWLAAPGGPRGGGAPGSGAQGRPS